MAFTAGVTALATGAASTGLNAVGQYQAGKAAKDQAKLDAAQNDAQAQLAEYNAGQIELYGKINSDMVKSIAGLNDKITSAVSDVNASLINATTDFNVNIGRATTDFNVSSAEGAARILQAQGDAQAQAHTFNASLDELQAQDTLDAGSQAERQSRGQYAQLKGQQRAALAANGVTLDEGSALRIQSDTDYASDQDADTIRSNTMKAALGYRIQGANEVMASKMASLNGQAQASDKMMEAVAAKISGETAITQAKTEGAVKALDTKMTSTFQILQNDMSAQVDAMNIEQQAKSDAWASRAQAIGFKGQAAQSRLSASSIHPSLMAGTSLLAGASSLASSYNTMKAAGVFTKKKAA